MVNSRDYMKYVFIFLFASIIYLSYLIISPFVSAILTSAVIAYIFYPLYEWLNGKIKKDGLSALIVSFVLILLLVAPSILMLSTMAKESQFIYVRSKQIFITGDIFSIGCAPEDTGFVCAVSNRLGEFIRQPSVRFHMEESIGRVTTGIAKSASDFVFSIPAIILNLFIVFFTTFYLFRDGKEIVKKAKNLLPLKSHHKKRIFHRLDEATYAIIYGSIIVALIQGAAGALGFFLIGISSPIIWGLIMAILALIPFIGTALVWLPISILLIAQGTITSSSSTILRGIGLLVYGALFISTIDNIIKPHIIGKKANIHPVLVLLGVLGGLALFGFIGFIVGPLILAITATLFDIYEKEKEHGNGLN